MGLGSLEIGYIVSIIVLLCISQCYAKRKVFNIIEVGATPDGRTDSSKALRTAWSEACANNGGGVILVPAVGRFLVLPVLLQGPCKGTIELQVDGDLLASSHKAFAIGYSWFKFYGVNNLVIKGLGRFVGRGRTAWPYNTCKYGSCSRLPITINLQSINNLRIRDITSVNSKLYHFNVHGCNDVVFDNVKVIAPGESPNTNGIHISKSTGVTIKNSFIATGDDCISFGRGSKDVKITNVHCGPGHGISIGSLGKFLDEPNINGIAVRDSKFVGTTNGVQIKTWSKSYPSVVSNITFVNVEMYNVERPIMIDQNYCPNNACKNNKVSMSRIQIKDVKFENIWGTSSEQLAVTLKCSQVFPCQGIVLNNINLAFNGSGSSTSICQNVEGSASRPLRPPSCL
ncbi:exopolygalacturonase-like [Cucurbita moschata]|uniref:Exopolygalacturonase-like n=1 Tax=Cucurbita moschata TaxID=3662 RepID=A0A6J1EVV0_CUCMO|nr:exopolygalacturonase-like [Cucurbita moschata]